MSPDQFQQWVGDLAPYFMKLALLSGFLGALLVWLMWELFGLCLWFAEKHARKRRAQAWKVRQELAKEQAFRSEVTLPRGEPAKHGAAALREEG